jgi:Protein of unknown function (DUF3106)
MIRASSCRWLLIGIISMMFVAHAQSQTAKAQTIQPKNPSTAASANTADNWHTLTPAQKEALSPLRDVWVRITPVKKQKWLDISTGYHLLSPDGQATLHFRMKEWASLTSKEREQARLNFAQTKKLSSDDKQSKWEAYKALSPEEKQKLAAINKATPVAGAAPAIKPVPANKLLTTPPTQGNGLKADDGKAPKRAIIIDSQTNAAGKAKPAQVPLANPASSANSAAKPANAP